MAHITSPTSYSMIEMIHLFFKMVDKDNDGFVTFEELQKASTFSFNHNGIVYEPEKNVIQEYLKGVEDYNAKISLDDLFNHIIIS
jgi:Ca2+-binding EF-hand superfamily protein